MDAQVLINSTDISEYILSIKRSFNYCAYSQSFSLDIPLVYPNVINPYDEIIIYESGVKVLTGYISSATKSAAEGIISIKGQDVYKKAIDYFIPTTYKTGVNQRVSVWVTFLLSLCGLTATFLDTNDPYVTENEDIGLDTIANIVGQMVEYAGWYCKIDGNGNISFNRIKKTGSAVSLDETNDILSINYDKSYDKTRNNVIVFGGVDTSFGEFTPIFAKKHVDLDFLPTDQTIVFGNHLIGTQDAAEDFAQDLLNETSRITFIKKLDVIGDPHLRAGEFVKINSDLFNGSALITSIESSFDQNGYTMSLILDDLCPRVIASVDRTSQILYAGTTASGVWVYDGFSREWSAINSGLTNLHINDLDVDENYFITSTPSGIYTKFGSDNWEYQHLTVSGYPIYGGLLTYPAVYADSINEMMYALVTFSGYLSTPHQTWMYYGSVDSGTNNVTWSGCPISLDGFVNNNGKYFYGTDLEGSLDDKFVVASNSNAGIGVMVGKPTSLTPEKLYLLQGLQNEVAYKDIFPSYDFVWSAKVSPNQQWIAFTALDFAISGEYGLYIMNVNGTGAFRVSNPVFKEANAVCWSPDSNYILVAMENTSSEFAFYVVNLFGVTVGRVGTLNAACYWLDWSPNGQEFAYIDDTHYPTYTEVYRSDLNGNKTIIKSGSPNIYYEWVDWTDDSNNVLVVQHTSIVVGKNIQKININTSVITVLVNESSSLRLDCPICIDADNFIYLGNNVIRLGSLVGTEKSFTSRASVLHLDTSWGCDWHPNGQSIVFSASLTSDSIFRLYTVDLYGTNYQELTPITALGLGAYLTNPRYSPSGEKILFMSNNDLWICDSDGGNPYLALSTSTIATYLSQYSAFPISSMIVGSGGTGFDSDAVKWLDDESIILQVDPFYIGYIGISTVLLKFNRNTQELLMLAPSYTEINNSNYSYQVFGFYPSKNYMLVMKTRLAANFTTVLEGYILKVALDQNYSYTIVKQGLSTSIAPIYPVISNDGTIIYYKVNGSTDSKFMNEDGSNDHSLSGFNETNLPVSWSPYSEAIIHRDSRSLSHIYRERIDGTESINLVSSQFRYYRTFKYHPQYRDLILVEESTDASRYRPTLIPFTIKLQDFGFNHISEINFLGGPQSFHNDLLIYNTTCSGYDLLYNRSRFREVNLDDPNIIAVYGKQDGIVYSTDFYETYSTFSGLKNSYDMSMIALPSGTNIFVTVPSGIYKFDLDRNLQYMNNATAREIVSSDEGTFFSILGQAKETVDDATSYSDISTGLSGSLITVLRLAEG
jgi:hypothetical protein